MQKWIARGAIVIAATLWGCIGLFYNHLTALGLSATEIVFLRTGLAAVIMFVYIVFRDHTWFRIRLRDVWMFIGTGIISLAFFNYCYFHAMDELGLSVSAMLLYTAPVFVMLLSAVLFREQMTFPKWIAVIGTFVGCLLVTGALGGGTITWSGVLFGIGSGIGYALYTIFGVVALRKYRTETITFYTFLLAAFSMLPLCRISAIGEVFLAEPLSAIGNTVGIALFACVLPYMLYTAGLQRVEAGEASIMATLEPVVATVVSVVAFNDHLSLPKIIGMLCIVGAIALLNIAGQKKSKER